ncbi:hypothetical protein J6TS2_05950 [Heyndrickxia sporothermodurans]|nr:hypothetical protein J6TS2_05950 [Heyndrickxia sporothermodurans]
MRKYLILFIQILVLWMINKVGYMIAEYLHIAIPGNVIGMLLLFILLVTGVIQLKWVEYAALILTKHLAFFFIPISVGLMTLGSVFISSGIGLIFVLVISAIIGIIGTGITSQLLGKKREVSSIEQHHHSI